MNNEIIKFIEQIYNLGYPVREIYYDTYDKDILTISIIIEKNERMYNYLKKVYLSELDKAIKEIKIYFDEK